MDENIRFERNKDGSFQLIVSMPEEEYLQLNQILVEQNISFQELINGLFKEIIRTGRIPFTY